MILATRGGDRQARGLNYLEVINSRAYASEGGVIVSEETLMGVPAATKAIRVAAEAVAERRELCVYRRQRGVRRGEHVTTTWQARFFAGLPNERGEDWSIVLEQTEASLTARWNAFWRVEYNDRGEVAAVYVCHPDCVTVKRDPSTGRLRYTVTDLYSGDTYRDLDDLHVVHFRGPGNPGAPIAPSPVEAHRHAIGAAIAKDRWEARFYERGLGQKVALVLPTEVTPDRARELQRIVHAENAGWEQWDKPAVFGGGATVTTIGLSMTDAQFIESQQYSAIQVCRILNVQASLVDAGATTSAKPLSPEHERDRWNTYGLCPRLTRIASRVRAHPGFFGAASRDYPDFDRDGLNAGDIATETSRLHTFVQDGVLLVDEARAELGLPPLPGGVGQVPQVTPVGGAPNPNPVPDPLAPDEGDDGDDDPA